MPTIFPTRRLRSTLRRNKSEICNLKSKIPLRRPRFESLENRSLLAGDIDISISDATATEGSSALKYIDQFVQPGSGGLVTPNGSTFGPDGNGDGVQDLYVTDRDADAIRRYDGVTGAFISTFVPSGSGGLDLPTCLAFSPSGHLFVSSETLGMVFEYDGSGAFLGVPVSGLTNGGKPPAYGLTFGPDGNLYIANSGTDEVLRFDGTNLTTFVSEGSGGLDRPRRAVFGPDGNLYVASTDTRQVLRYNGQTGAFISVFATNALPGPGPAWLEFGTDGYMYTSSRNASTSLPTSILRYNAVTGAFIDALDLGRDGWSFTLGPDNAVYNSSNAAGSFIDRLGPSSWAAFAVSLSTPSATPVTVTYSTASSSATSGTDFTAASGTLTFAPGQTSRTILNQTLDDTTVEGNETFTVNLSSPVGGVITYSQGVGTIQDDDAGRQITISDASATEGGTLVFTVQLSTASALATTVNFATAGGTATSGSDFTAASGTLTFAPGQTSKTITVSTVNDTTYEPTETFTVNLTSPVGGVIADGQAIGTILDNDPQPTKFYVVDDGSTNKTFEYAADGTAIENYAVNSGNTAPRGVATTAAGTMVWVVDANKKVYVYNTSGGLLGSWTAGSLPSNATVQGITTNGTDIWIIDDKGNKVYRYAGAASRLSGSQNPASSFNLNSSNGNPMGLVTDGASLWVVNNSSTDKVFKYTVSGTLQGSWTISGGGGSPTGITIDPANVSNIWIVDSATDRVYQFNAAATRTSGSQSPASYFALAAGNTNPQGIADPPPPSAAVAIPVAAESTPAAGARESGLSIASLDFVLGDSSPRRPTADARSASSVPSPPRSSSASRLASVLRDSHQAADSRDDFFASLAVAKATGAKRETEHDAIEAAVDCLFADGDLLLHRLI